MRRPKRDSANCRGGGYSIDNGSIVRVERRCLVRGGDAGRGVTLAVSLTKLTGSANTALSQGLAGRRQQPRGVLLVAGFITSACNRQHVCVII